MNWKGTSSSRPADVPMFSPPVRRCIEREACRAKRSVERVEQNLGFRAIGLVPSRSDGVSSSRIKLPATVAYGSHHGGPVWCHFCGLAGMIIPTFNFLFDSEFLALIFGLQSFSDGIKVSRGMKTNPLRLIMQRTEREMRHPG